MPARVVRAVGIAAGREGSLGRRGGAVMCSLLGVMSIRCLVQVEIPSRLKGQSEGERSELEMLNLGMISRSDSCCLPDAYCV